MSRATRIWSTSALVLLASIPALGQGGPPPALVAVDAVRQERIEQRREVTGELRAVKRAEVATEESGQVVAMEVEAGDAVKAGQVIARLDDELRRLDVERLRAEVASDEAQVQERQAQVLKAQRDLSRLEDLSSRSGASQNEVDDAKTRVAEEKARLAQAEADQLSSKADLHFAERRLLNTSIVAPFDGSVVAKRTEVGQWLGEGDPVVDMVALSAVDAFLDVPERFIGALASSGSAVELRIPAIADTLSVSNVTILAEGDRLARTFRVRVRVDNAGPQSPGKGRLKPGMSVIGMVPTGEPADVLTIHKDAVMRNDAGSYVYFDGGGVAAVAPIESMFAVGDRVVVRSPVLKPGMNIITQGNERVFPGQPLKLLDASAPAAEPTPAAAPSGGSR
jgi:RND family efflux transporter MFP subunit